MYIDIDTRENHVYRSIDMATKLTKVTNCDLLHLYRLTSAIAADFESVYTFLRPTANDCTSDSTPALEAWMYFSNIAESLKFASDQIYEILRITSASNFPVSTLCSMLEHAKDADTAELEVGA